MWISKALNIVLLVAVGVLVMACLPDKDEDIKLASTRYNIVLIMAEDLSPRIGVFGDLVAHTPNLDRLASQGIMFLNTFTTASVCSTSRSTHITGVHQQTLGSMHHRAGSFKEIPYEVVPPEGIKAYPELLRAAGYYVTNRSKTDYQIGRPFTIWDDSSADAHWRNRPAGIPFFSMITIPETHESYVWPTERKTDDQMIRKVTDRNKALASLKTHLTKPDVVEVHPYYPDTPVVRAALARHYGNIAFMDRRVQSILDELEADGLLDTTIVIWTTDHGDGLPRGKRSLYDSGTRVPMIVRLPHSMGAGTVNEELVSFVDMAPTILSVAGVPVPDYIQGRVFLGEQKGVEPDYIYTAADRNDQVYRSGKGVRSREYKYIRNAKPEQPYFVPDYYQDISTIMAELWAGKKADTLNDVQMANFRPRPGEELYRIADDPHEVHNLALAPAYGEQLATMRAALDAWNERIGDLSRLPERELVERMWPDGVQPETKPPHVSREKGRLVLREGTPGASMGYRVLTGEETGGAWQLYAGPATIPVGATVEVKSIRYGFRESPVIEISP
jgi:arylsulfatase A-like enzyme